MEYDSRVNERLMQTTEDKVDSSKALDASLVDTRNSADALLKGKIHEADLGMMHMLLIKLQVPSSSILTKEGLEFGLLKRKISQKNRASWILIYKSDSSILGLCIFAKMARLVAKGYAQATPRRVGIVSRESFAPVAAWEAGLKKDALPLNLRQKNGQYICCQNHKLIADIRDNDNHGTKVANRTNLTPAIQGFLLTDENLSSICLEILTLSIDISIHEIVDIE
ncbi:hypothetical protein Tco_1576978 [Tanacetum coccineum]